MVSAFDFSRYLREDKTTVTSKWLEQNPRQKNRKRSGTYTSDLNETSTVDSLDTGSLDSGSLNTGNSLLLEDWHTLIFYVDMELFI